MQVRDVMTSQVDVIAPSATLVEAARRMRDEDVGALPVGEDDRLMGMLTDRDIVVRAAADGKDSNSSTVRDAMSDRVLYCFDDQECAEVAASMASNQIRRLPVINRDKRLVGIVSLGDLAVDGPSGAAAEALQEISKPSR